ncbi:MAG: alpha/beta fold hydrolase [Actinomycetota bacterium]
MSTRHVITLLVASTLLLVACGSDASEDGGATASDAPIVLVHGAWQDGSSWAQVQQQLEGDGRNVSAVTLPGRDGDDAGAQTLDGYRDAVIAEVETYDEPVILVGHSFGGMTISAVAEAIPDQIESLVYLAAYLPSDGDSLSTLAEGDRLSVLGEDGNLDIAADFSVATVPQDRFAAIFCPDCGAADAETVTASALVEPAMPLATPVSLTAENFGAVPKFYIMTAQDIVVGPQLQASMVANTPVDEVFVLDAGHAPYVSAADDVAGLLVGLP